MTESTDIKVPDIGEFTDVEIIEVHVKPGDRIAGDDPLITLESDKAAMDVPAPVDGEVAEVLVSVGHKVSAGDVILRLSAAPAGREKQASAAQRAAEPEAAAAATEYDLVVLGSGPGGYTAAFRAADLGLEVALVERYPTLGGVCLNVGCIPSKALLHAARVIEETAEMAQCGIRFGEPEIDSGGLRDWKNRVVGRLTDGLASMAGQRRVTVIVGEGRFVSPQQLRVNGEAGEQVIGFRHCIIAAGSESVSLPGLPADPRVIDSTQALELPALPKRMLVIGGGIIGLEMATVYDALGVSVSVVELTEQLMPGCDKDLLQPLQKRIKARYEQVMLATRVVDVTAADAGLTVTFEGKQAPDPQTYGLVLVSVGRKPNGGMLDAENAGVLVDEHGFIPVDKQMRSNVPHIFAIGDISGPPMLAHKATHEGKVAAEVAAGKKRAFDARAVPSVAYTDPEVAWVGMTEGEAKAAGVNYGKGSVPWAASGRALALNRDEGRTKILFDEASGRVIGAGIVGPNAGDLIAELCLAIEMGCDAADIGLTIHPHPTLSETVGMAAEAFEGTLTDLYMPKRKAR